MSLVQLELQRLGGREVTSVFEETNFHVQTGIVLGGLDRIRNLFLSKGEIHKNEQLMIAMYGMNERRYFALPAHLDKYSFVPQLSLALMRDTDKVWGTLPKI